MAPRQSRKSEPIPAHSSDAEDSGEQSQEDSLDPLKAAQIIMTKFKNIREVRRNALEVEHQKEVKDTAVKIDTLFKSRKNKVTKSRLEALDRLLAMNKRRQAIESQILTIMRHIEMHSANISNELDAIFTGRIEEMEESKSNT